MNPLTIRVVAECLEIIESKLREPIDVEGLAAVSGYSRWHFQRVFQALVGETLGSYIRKRRLSVSSVALTRSDARIVEIALDYRFQSHEAYSRAFKKQFSVTPQEYRRLGRDRAHGPHRLREHAIMHLDQHIQPAIVLEREFRMVGVSGCFHRIRSDRYDGQVVADLWQAFFAQRDQVRNLLDDVALGVISPRAASNPDDDEGIYVAGAQVTRTDGNLPGLEPVHLPPRMYALFEHHGHMNRLRETMDSIYAVWLIDNETYTTDDSPSVEIYTRAFQPRSSDSVFSIAIPVVPK